ncbi:MAG: phytanoyl-CoA dioxygenase family protein [Planctomycetes bacterium]|nr:phytanoyl-CoA dioxygenase family protein [Planctomycetota bacterium]
MSRDYGLDDRPVTELFNQPRSSEEWRSYALSEEQIRHFKDFGFIKDIKVLNDEQVERLRADLQDLVNPSNPGNEFFYEYHSNESEDPDTVLFHALGAWRVSPAFHDILWAPAFRMVAYQLIGKGFRLFHDQLFSKPAKHGAVVAWHQDYSYWTWTSPMNHLTSWIALDDASTENGCMYYIPKSHKWGLLEKTGLAGDMNSVRQVLTDAQVSDFDNRVPIEMKIGHASFHHPLLMHGSYENRSDRSRRATLINVFADGVVSNRDHDNAPGADNYPAVPKGEPMGGTYYPLLLDPQTEIGQLDDIPTV